MDLIFMGVLAGVSGAFGCALGNWLGAKILAPLRRRMEVDQ